MDANIIKQKSINMGFIPIFFNEEINKLLVKTNEGYLGYTTNNGLNRGDNISVVSIYNPYTIDNIKTFIRNKQLDCKLLTIKWESHKTPLILECPECHSEYECLWDTLREKQDGLCQNCVNKRLIANKRKDINRVKQDFLNRGYKPLFHKYNNNSERLLVKDKNGYLGEMTYKQLLNGSGFRPFHPKNKYTISNIKLFLLNNGYTCELLTSEYKNNLSLMNFKCECGEHYKSSLTTILRGQALRCDSCTKVKSNLEQVVEEWLNKNNMHFENQYRFQDCRNIYPLPFDYMLTINNHKYVIEVNGVQHYESVDFFGGEESLNYRKQNDNIKKEYCLKNNIKYIEISYKDIKNDNYKKILKNKLLP